MQDCAQQTGLPAGNRMTGREVTCSLKTEKVLVQGQVLWETTRIQKSYYCLMMKAINFWQLVFLRKSTELEENVNLGGCSKAYFI